MLINLGLSSKNLSIDKLQSAVPINPRDFLAAKLLGHTFKKEKETLSLNIISFLQEALVTKIQSHL